MGAQVVFESLGCHVQLLGIVALRLLPKAKQKQTERKEVRRCRRRHLSSDEPSVYGIIFKITFSS